MTDRHSAPRGEHTPRPGVTWESWAEWLGEQYVPDTDTSSSTPLSDTAGPDLNQPDPPRPPNRATRRALKRAARRTK